MTKMHLMWFCAFSPHAGFGLDGWAGPQTGHGYDWTQPKLWQDMAVVLERAKFDLIMLGDSLRPVVTALGLSRATMRVVRQNLIWAVVYNATALPLAVAGLVPPWLAAIGMSASSLVVVLNALRLNRYE